MGGECPRRVAGRRVSRSVRSGATTETAACRAAPPRARAVRPPAAGQPPDVVFRRFADDLDDPLADLVAVGLLIAVTRGEDRGRALGAAEQARHQADRRRIVEAEPHTDASRGADRLAGDVRVARRVFCLRPSSSYLNAYDTSRAGVPCACPGRLRRLVDVGWSTGYLPATVAVPDASAGRLVTAAARLIVATLLGSGGVWLLLSGAAQRRPSLAKVSTYLARPATLLAAGPVDGWARVGRSLAGRLRLRPAVIADLRLMRRSLEVHSAYLAAAAVAGLFGPSLLLAIGQALGVVSIGLWVPLGLALAGALVADRRPQLDALGRGQHRNDLRYQLSSYLDVVTMLLAGNVGNEGALRQAARRGTVGSSSSSAGAF